MRRSNSELVELINRYPSIYTEAYKLGCVGAKAENPYSEDDENLVWQCGYEDGLGDQQVECYSPARAFVFGMEYASIVMHVEHGLPIKKKIHSVIFSRVKYLCKYQNRPLKYKIINDDWVEIEISSENDTPDFH